MILFPLSVVTLHIFFCGEKGYLWFHLQIFGMPCHDSFRPQGQGTEVCSPLEDASSKAATSGWLRELSLKPGETLAKVVAFPTPPKKRLQICFYFKQIPSSRWDSTEFFHKENPLKIGDFFWVLNPNSCLISGVDCCGVPHLWCFSAINGPVCFHVFLLSDQGCDSNGCFVSNEFCSMPQLQPLSP